MKSFYLALLLLFPISNLYSQNQFDCSNRLKNKQLFTNEIELKEWLNSFEKDTLKMLDCLKEQSSDSIFISNLSQSIYLIKNLSINASNVKIKGAAIKLFISVGKSNNPSVSALSINALKSYSSRNFDESDISSILELIEKHPSVYKETVELAGYIGNQKFLLKIKEVFPNSRNFSKPEKWASYKSLARLGDNEALDFCVKRISSIPINDQVIDVLYPDLIYIHRKEAIDLLIKALNSDDLLCTSSNPNSDSKILCGYRIMELLAPAIENFPVKVLPSGDLDTKDYKKTLNDVRVWFSKNGNSYSITSKY